MVIFRGVFLVDKALNERHMNRFRRRQHHRKARRTRQLTGNTDERNLESELGAGK